MRALHVIHGFPPHYMAGSEVYTHSLVHALKGAVEQVAVFTRVENEFAPAYAETTETEDGVLVRRVNKPRGYTFGDKYRDAGIEEAFRRFAREVRPDVVHISHLSHLSTGIVEIARAELRVPVVFTVHDFWMFCFRGQLVDPQLRVCPGPSDGGCLACAAHQFKDTVSLEQVAAARSHMAEAIRLVDLFLAPSRTVERFFIEQGVPAAKVAYSPYGFDGSRLGTALARAPRAGPLRFGFLGRVIPVKGVALLLRAFRRVRGAATLRIHGHLNGNLAFLDELRGGDDRIELAGSYPSDGVGEVLRDLDVVVVPSLWLENAPLVIQEAQLAGLPVVTSDAGGMAELVQHGENGFLFPLGDEDALAGVLQRIVDRPACLDELHVDPSKVRSIADDARSCVEHYRRLCSPRRLTLVTNPGLCNMACPMCDTHSIFGKPQAEIRKLPMLAWDPVEATVRELARLGLREVIPSTMGEPLMYPHFDRLLALLLELGLTLNLTTNGSFPRGGVEGWAPRLLPVLSDMKVSLNGIAADVNERVMVHAETAQQIANVEAFVRHRDRQAAAGGRRATMTIQATFMETNLAELPSLLRWAIRTGLDRFKGHHLWVTWPQLAAESLRRDAEAARRWNDMVAVLRAIAETERGPSGQRIRLDNVVPLDPDAADGPPADSECPFLGEEAWLEADGSFQVCCCPSEKRKAFGDFGNVADTPFPQLWSSPRYREFLAGWGDHPNCLTCNMRRPKGGSARG